MKYRLVELLQCPACAGTLEVVAEECATALHATESPFRCQLYCARDRTSARPAEAQCVECNRTEVVSGTLVCRGCSQKFRIVEAVPWLFDEQAHEADCRFSDTTTLYSYLWNKGAAADSPASSHVEGVEESLGESVARGKIGLDAGSGRGTDTVLIAQRDPLVEILSLDLSEGVYATRRATEGLPNVHVIRGSVLELPLKSGICDFAYSFGVLHHTPDPDKGMREIARVLKEQGRVSLYLYEDHEDNLWKALPLNIVSALRRVTTRLGPRTLSAFCCLLSPLVVIAFSIPARIMRRFERMSGLADRMPFNFGTSLFSVHGDLLDRFGAPFEARYNREGAIALLKAGGLSAIKTAKLKASAGWVAQGLKTSA